MARGSRGGGRSQGGFYSKRGPSRRSGCGGRVHCHPASAFPRRRQLARTERCALLSRRIRAADRGLGPRDLGDRCAGQWVPCEPVDDSSPGRPTVTRDVSGGTGLPGPCGIGLSGWLSEKLAQASAGLLRTMSRWWKRVDGADAGPPADRKRRTATSHQLPGGQGSRPRSETAAGHFARSTPPSRPWWRRRHESA
jgi:hypothetical protein